MWHAQRKSTPAPYYDPAHPCESDGEEPVSFPSYTPASLYPTQPDPSCDPTWPLAPYWPVYVSNFRVDDREEKLRNAQISSFFASRGLLTRMIFVDEKCKLFNRFQCVFYILDMLVYFTSQRDAEQAIRCFNRTTYHGHRLNVLPGRKPEFFKHALTVSFQPFGWKNGSETVVERNLREIGCSVEAVSRSSDGRVLVEFVDDKSKEDAVRSCTTWIPSLLKEATTKQRYLERDVSEKLLAMIADKAGFMDMVPPPEVLSELMNGRIPALEKPWENIDRPIAGPDKVLQKKAEKRKVWVEKLKAEKALKKQKGKDPDSNVLLSKPKEVKKKGSGLKEHKKLVRQGVQRISRGALTRTDVVGLKLNHAKKLFLETRQELLSECGKTSKRACFGLFYKLLALEEELMQLIPQSDGSLDCPQLELGLVKAIVVAGIPLPFPEQISYEQVDKEAYEDEEPPPSDEDRPPVPETIPVVRPYSPADLNPPEHDPDCDSKWPLANFWPVYVGNFRVNTLDEERLNRQVVEYFAAKGLLAVRVFVRTDSEDRFFRIAQRKNLLLDMLVYLTSRQDTLKAIELCHRDSYYGHRLNVFPGREPVFYALDRTGQIYMKKQQPSTEYIERVILKAPPEVVMAIVQPDLSLYRFEFAQSEESFESLTQNCKKKIRILSEPTQKQRFLEADVKDTILLKMFKDPVFSRAQPRAELMEAFHTGSIPSRLLNWNWYGWSEPRVYRTSKERQQLFDLNTKIYEVLDLWIMMQKAFDK